MKTFTDNKGRAWTIQVTIGAVKRVKDRLGADLLEPESGSPSLLTRIGTDTLLVCNIARVLVEPQARAAGVTDEDFDESLTGSSISELFDAFYESLADFFQTRGQPARAKMLLAQRELIVRAFARGEAMVDALDLDAIVKEVFGKTSGSSPAPSA